MLAPRVGSSHVPNQILPRTLTEFANYFGKKARAGGNNGGILKTVVDKYRLVKLKIHFEMVFYNIKI